MNTCKFKISGMLLTVWFAAAFLLSFNPDIPSAENRVRLFFFYGEGCTHCSLEKTFLKRLQLKYPQLEVVSYETWRDNANAGLFSRVCKAYGIEASGVPATFIGDFDPIVGYADDDSTGREIEKSIAFCIDKGCIDPAGMLTKPGKTRASPGSTMVRIPGFGKMDASRIALPLLTVILGGLDSFNPCAFFVLFTLLGILVHAKTRSRMFAIGGVFVFFSGLIYFIFMAAWLNFFLYAGEFKAITLTAGAVAVVIALINIKDFFFFAKGISLVIPEGAKPKLFERMRGLLKATSTFSMLAGTAVLAVAANTYELLCTAGFPMVFTRVLTLNNLGVPQYYLYLFLYNVIYVIPLAVIVATFTLTLGRKRLTERQGQVLKLVSGFMMLCLGLALLINPSLFNNILTSAGLILLALAAAGTVILIAEKTKK